MQRLRRPQAADAGARGLFAGALASQFGKQVTRAQLGIDMQKGWTWSMNHGCNSELWSYLLALPSVKRSTPASLIV
eukprot:6479061-Amphidinium_carterae.1